MLPLRLRPLQPDDISSLMAIENRVFSLPWPASVYLRELTENPHSRYYILELIAQGQQTALGEAHGLAGDHSPVLLGYGGYWIVIDEAHILTFAIAPAWQGRGLGEWLLLGLMDLMDNQGIERVTLEVRVSNRAAQTVYRRLGLQVEGRRRRYYSDNREDALIMTSPDLDSPEMQALRRRRRAALLKRLGQQLLAPSGDPTGDSH